MVQDFPGLFVRYQFYRWFWKYFGFACWVYPVELTKELLSSIYNADLAYIQPSLRYLAAYGDPIRYCITADRTWRAIAPLPYYSRVIPRALYLDSYSDNWGLLAIASWLSDPPGLRPSDLTQNLDFEQYFSALASTTYNKATTYYQGLPDLANTITERGNRIMCTYCDASGTGVYLYGYYQVFDYNTLLLLA